jgi:flagellar motor switch protein FliN
MSSSARLPDDPARSFIRLWMESIASVVGQIASVTFPVEEGALESEPAPGPNDLYLTIFPAGVIRGEMGLHLPSSSALDLAKLFMGDNDAAHAELTADDRSAAEELFRQIAGHVSTSARTLWAETPLTVALGEAPTWSSGATGWIRSATSAPLRIQIEWSLSSALATSLTAAQQAKTAAQATMAPTPPQGPASNFDLLMNIELDVTLRFGERNILLKEILELGPGSLLELDREIQEPADLLLDGRLIARGEVVVVDGNFGLRVTEVCGPQLSA